jgi:hypothetical protein
MEVGKNNLVKSKVKQAGLEGQARLIYRSVAFASSPKDLKPSEA